MILQQGKCKSIWRNNGLSITLFLFFVATLIGQSFAGWRVENDSLREHMQATVSYGAYLASSSFLEITMENWESEFLQMFVYVVFTVFLFQKGSAESKDPDAKETEVRVTKNSPYPVRVGGWRLSLYKYSMSIAFLTIFLITFVLHAIGGMGDYNEDQLRHGGNTVSLGGYLISSRFWLESLQNWQSEFLSLWAMVVLSIFLRQQGSPESKPVASPHSSTGDS